MILYRCFVVAVLLKYADKYLVLFGKQKYNETKAEV